MNNFRHFSRGIISHWLALMSGGVIIVAFGLFERAAGRNLSTHFYVSLICLLVVIAACLAWCDKQRELAAARQEIDALRRELVKEREPVNREFESIRMKILTSTLTFIITEELRRLRELILDQRELLAREDVRDFYVKWIKPYDTELHFGAQLDLTKTQYDRMRQDLISIGNSPKP